MMRLIEIEEFQKIINFLIALSKEELVQLFKGRVDPSLEDKDVDVYRFNVLAQIPLQELQEIKNKAAIQIGDEVELAYPAKKCTKGYVTKVAEDGCYWILLADGSYTIASHGVRKTGQHSQVIVNFIEDWQENERNRTALAAEMGLI